jgi:hypothetical protein
MFGLARRSRSKSEDIQHRREGVKSKYMIIVPSTGALPTPRPSKPIAALVRNGARIQESMLSMSSRIHIYCSPYTPGFLRFSHLQDFQVDQLSQVRRSRTIVIAVHLIPGPRPPSPFVAHKPQIDTSALPLPRYVRSESKLEGGHARQAIAAQQ